MGHSRHHFVYFRLFLITTEICAAWWLAQTDSLAASIVLVYFDVTWYCKGRCSGRPQISGALSHKIVGHSFKALEKFPLLHFLKVLDKCVFKLASLCLKKNNGWLACLLTLEFKSNFLVLFFCLYLTSLINLSALSLSFFLYHFYFSSWWCCKTFLKEV